MHYVQHYKTLMLNRWDNITVGPKGITCLMVEKGTPGMSFGAKEKKVRISVTDH